MFRKSKNSTNRPRDFSENKGRTHLPRDATLEKLLERVHDRLVVSKDDKLLLRIFQPVAW
jgi:hypothetical protein